MIYFKSEKLENLEEGLIEKSVRRFSSKRNLNLDLKSTSQMVEEDSRYFLGIENTKHLKITRLRTPFEKYFPKLIIRFSKSDYKTYSVRFSLFTFILSILIIGGLINDFIKLISTQLLSARFLMNIFFLLILVILTKIELKFTKKKIMKAIYKTKGFIPNKNKPFF